MTFNSAPWAVDGARTSAALARSATYSTGGGRSGITKPSDLRVLPLAVPGNGLRITSGTATILNGYLANPDEAYVVSNPGTHTVLSSTMPPAVPQVAHYMVAVVVGDPEFNQTGHPFMPSTPLSPEDAADFDYVRVVIVPCPANATEFEQLNLPYPAYGLARLEIPPNTTTITGAMITDLRGLTQARAERDVDVFLPPAGGYNLIGTGWMPWPMQAGHSVRVPRWATKATVVATITGVFAAAGSTSGGLRILLTPSIGSPEVIYDIDVVNGQRETFAVAFSGDISAYAGQDITITVQGYRVDGPVGHLTTFGGSQLILDVGFSESVI